MLPRTAKRIALLGLLLESSRFFFPSERIVEVDAPGLMSPVLSRFDFEHLARPIFPVDARVQWQGPRR
jgi:hypothetical protein